MLTREMIGRTVLHVVHTENTLLISFTDNVGIKFQITGTNPDEQTLSVRLIQIGECRQLKMTLTPEQIKAEEREKKQHERVQRNRDLRMLAELKRKYPDVS